MRPHEARLRPFLTLSDEELWCPLWEWPWDQRADVLRARERRRYASWVPSEPDDAYMPSESLTPVLDFAPTE